jgi:hypothetical protein
MRRQIVLLGIAFAAVLVFCAVMNSVNAPKASALVFSITNTGTEEFACDPLIPVCVIPTHTPTRMVCSRPGEGNCNTLTPTRTPTLTPTGVEVIVSPDSGRGPRVDLPRVTGSPFFAIDDTSPTPTRTAQP